jgi:cobalt-precorrin 5A hydrolase
MQLDKIVIAVTKNGSVMGKKLASFLKADLRIPRRFTINTKFEYGYDRSVALEIQEAFNRYQVLILIMATGIAVRSIAPMLENKQIDPAVIVMDEAGKFVISLISGHREVVNRLAEEVANYTGGAAVITTASDVINLPSVDLMAAKYELMIENKELLPEFSSAVINGEPIVIWDRWGIKENWPDNIRVETGESFILTEADKLLVIVGYQEPLGIRSSIRILALRPNNLVVGVGYCQGVTGTRIVGAIRRYFRERNWSVRSIQSLATIDLNADEPGINSAVSDFGVPLQVYSKEELEVEMKGLEKSVYFESTKGVNEVCEPAAIIGSKLGKLIGTKQNLNQITVAVAAIKERIDDIKPQ